MKFTQEQIEAMRAEFDHDAITAQVNSKFLVGWDDVRIECELVEVTPINTSKGSESFSLFFKMPPDFPYKQGLMIFEHPVIGKKEILVVALEHDQDGMLFEAVINRLLPKS